jgi:hypothetical protein
MKQESDLEMGGAQVIAELASCDRRQQRGRLRLDDQNVVHDQVQTLHSRFVALVHDTHGQLTHGVVAPGLQLSLECGHVKILEKAIPECVVDMKERADHRSCERLFPQHVSRHAEDSRTASGWRITEPRRR